MSPYEFFALVGFVLSSITAFCGVFFADEEHIVKLLLFAIYLLLMACFFCLLEIAFGGVG